MSYTDEDYFVPVEDQRVFGAGISRKRVQFVRSSEHELHTTATTTTTAVQPPGQSSGPSIADKYLSIVLPKDASANQRPETTKSIPSVPAAAATSEPHSAPPSPSSIALPATKSQPLCEVCNLPLTNPNVTAVDRPHEASLAHQLCLTHSHPPSHLDRTRHGLRYLSAYGWDPDSRLGLGAPGREGIREPLKGQVKHDTVGLGVKKIDPKKKPAPAKVQKLNAKQVRKSHVDAKMRGERLREMFYRNDDIQKYLGGG